MLLERHPILFLRKSVELVHNRRRVSIPVHDFHRLLAAIPLHYAPFGEIHGGHQGELSKGSDGVDWPFSLMVYLNLHHTVQPSREEEPTRRIRGRNVVRGMRWERDEKRWLEG
jgi:hypothetical protein